MRRDDSYNIIIQKAVTALHCDRLSALLLCVTPPVTKVQQIAIFQNGEFAVPHGHQTRMLVSGHTKSQNNSHGFRCGWVFFFFFGSSISAGNESATNRHLSERRI